ncbi:MAG: PAS domain S-box protein [Candidatus Didemnitutus sp.]|nr:PAS domain S-box protein [Candidatus Didemnitutus sp.]
MKTKRLRLPAKVALGYAIGAGLWILASDGVLGWLNDSGVEGRDLGTLKGLGFVGVTSGLLFGLLVKLQARQERTRQALDEQERRWRLALSAVGDGVWESDRDMRDSRISDQWQATLGYGEGEIGSSMRDWAGLIHPDDRLREAEAWQGCFADGEGVYRCEYRVRARDGGWRWVLARGRLVDTPDSPAIRRLIGIHTDVTAQKEADLALREAAVRYRTLFEANPNPMWVYDVETLALLIGNEAALKKYGYSREQLTGMTLRDLRDPKDVPLLLEFLRDLKGAVYGSGPWRHRRADGSPLSVEITSHEIDWEGRRARIILAHDVTGEESARLDVAKSEEKFRGIYEAAHDAILLLDGRNCFADCNTRALELFRADRSDLVGQYPWILSPLVQPAGGRGLEHYLGQPPVRQGKLRAPFACRLRRIDGSEFDAEITLSSQESGSATLQLVIVRDVTDRKKTKAQLDLLQAALQAAPVGWLITNKTGLIEWANPAFTSMTGYALDEVIGRNPRLFRSGEHSNEFYSEMWRTIMCGEVWRGDLHNQRKDGSLYHEHMVIAPVRDDRGEIAHFVAMKQDITVERRLEQQLVRAQQLESIGLLASGIAHDLNNVLAPIVLGVDLLKTEPMNPEARTRLELVGRAARRGAGVVKQLLTFARGGDGERASVQLRYLVKEVAQLTRETFPPEIEIEVVADDGVPPVYGDVTQIHQVLLNLAINARDAMPQGGRLTFGLRRVQMDAEKVKLSPGLKEGGYLELSVKDTGTGITEDVMAHLFDPFFTTKPQGKGTGLGLATVYGIVRGHGGEVEVATRVDRGSTFRVLLPEYSISTVPVPSVSEGSSAWQGEGRWVLVVDDEEAIRTVVKEILTRRGFKVVTAADGVQALQLFLLRPKDYAVVIVDMMMPRMNGAVLVGELRAQVPELPVIRCSGLAEQLREAEPAAPQRGFEAFLSKPFSAEQLLSTLERACATRSAQD